MRKQSLIESLNHYNKSLLVGARIFFELHENEEDANLLAQLSGVIIEITHGEYIYPGSIVNLREQIASLASKYLDREVYTVLLLSSALNAMLAVEHTSKQHIEFAQTKINLATSLINQADICVPEGMRRTA